MYTLYPPGLMLQGSTTGTKPLDELLPQPEHQRLLNNQLVASLVYSIRLLSPAAALTPASFSSCGRWLRCWLLERHVKCSLIVGILILPAQAGRQAAAPTEVEPRQLCVCRFVCEAAWRPEIGDSRTD